MYYLTQKRLRSLAAMAAGLRRRGYSAAAAGLGRKVAEIREVKIRRRVWRYNRRLHNA